MKKYLHYNVAYSNSPTDVGVQSKVTPQGRQDALDLSGKSDAVAMVAAQAQKWTNEQEEALDLSGYSREQDEALDLTKPVPKKGNNGFNQSGIGAHQQLHRSNVPVLTPPSSKHSRSPAGQSYSLLQAALNSSQPNAGLEDRAGQSAPPYLDTRLFGLTDVTRGIKPFTTRPMGITMPHMATSSGAIIPGSHIIQGSHKPIAITTPQPHHPHQLTTKSQTVSDTTVSVTESSQSISSISNQSYDVSQSNYSNAYPGTASNAKLGVAKRMSQINNQSKGNFNMMERYMLQNPEGFPAHLLGAQNMLSTEILSGFSCTQCSKVFKTKAAMKLHMTVHKTSEERQYGCQVCGRRFLHRHHLVVHQRKHSGEKPFKCNACGKTFMAIFLLHKHLRKHSRESGQVSDMSIEQLKQLQEQKLINTGPQPLTYMNVPPRAQSGELMPVIDEKPKRQTCDSAAVAKLEKEQSERDMERRIGQVIGEVLRDTQKEREKIASAVKSTEQKAKVGDQGKQTVEIPETSAAETSLGVLNDGSSDRLGGSETFKVQLGESVTETREAKVETELQKVDKNEPKDKSFQPKDKDNPQVTLSETEIKKEDIMITEHKEAVIETTGVKEEVSDKMEEKPVSFPVYTSDDEVELDPNTGELIVFKGKRLEKQLQAANYPEVSESNMNVDQDISENSDVQKGEENDTVINMKSDKILSDEIKSETEPVIESSQPSEKSRSETQNVNMTPEANEVPKFENEINSVQKCSETDSDNITDLEQGMDPATKEKSMETNESEQIEICNVTSTLEQANTDTDNKNISSDIKSVMKELTDQVCGSDGDGMKFESAIKDVKLSEHGESEMKSLSGSSSQSNIFEKMYESVSDMRVVPQLILKGRKGKKKSRKVKCEICSRSFHSNHYLLLHMAVHKRNPMLQSLKKAKANQMKVLGFVNKTNVVCEVCNKSFKFQKSLNSHMRVHSEKLIERKLYRKAFRDFVSGGKPQSVKKADTKRQSLDSESQQSSANIESKARLSLESVTTETSEGDKSAENFLDDDEPPIRIIIGSDNVKRYVCHACDNTYTTKQKLRLHALIHKDNCYLCDICGKSFFRQLTLEKHISTHKLPRPHICEVCKKTFIHRSSLMRHKTVHMKPVIPNQKQQLADLNFELKMRDTYTMLREERFQQQQQQVSVASAPVMDASVNISPKGLKYDPLDLTVRIRPEEQCLPPVLSPANLTSVSQSSSWHLSPPLITEEPVDSKSGIRQSLGSSTDELEENGKDRLEMLQAVKQTVKRKPRTESGCSESDVLSSDGNHSGPKKSRKTRVYSTSCRVCKEMFPNVMLLKAHMVVHNTVETHLYECHICQHRFTQSCSLLRHLKTSCQENRMKCIPCNKTFHRRNTFEQHMRLHEGGPTTNLDGSFYDKRRDEAEVREERESDIENNNSSKQAVDVVVQPLTVENVTLFDQVTSGAIKTEERDADETDSDARTYLYSEGEVHERTTELSDDMQKGPAVAEDLTKNQMTLNLLSAVCSDIRNAEKEEELKRKELEEKQRELETIEILANLKRGAMQKSGVDPIPVPVSERPNMVPLPSAATNQIPVSHFRGPVQPLTKHSSMVADKEYRKVAPPKTHLTSPPLQETKPQGAQKAANRSKSSGQRGPSGSLPDTSTSILSAMSSAISTGMMMSLPFAGGGHMIPTQHTPQYPAFADMHPFQRIPSIIDTNLEKSQKPNIPTVVQEVSRKKQKAPSHSSTQSMSVSTSSTSFTDKGASKSPRPSQQMYMSPPPQGSSTIPSQMLSGKAHPMLHDLGQMKNLPPAAFFPPDIQKRLPLLMKAQGTPAHPITQQAALAHLASLPMSQQHFHQFPVPSSVPSKSANIKSPPPSQQVRSRTPVQSPASSMASDIKHEFDMPQDLSVKTPKSESPCSITQKSSPASLPPPMSYHVPMVSLSQVTSIPERSRAALHERSSSTETMPLPPRPEGLVVDPRLRPSSVPLPPPLVSVFQCELCNKVVYNKIDLHLHMVEHAKMSGIDVLSRKMPAPKSIEEILTDKPADLTQPDIKPVIESSPTPSKQGPSTSLDLSIKKSNKSESDRHFENQSDKKPEIQSAPLTKPSIRSEFQQPGTQPLEKPPTMQGTTEADDKAAESSHTPPTSSSAGLDVLRQELRQKIFSRRKSQGLEDLKVEFKQPEPTEMSEEERLKLLYRRECNRQAAQRSRMRKKDLVDSLLERLGEMPSKSHTDTKDAPSEADAKK